MSWFPTDFATSLADKQKLRGKSHEANAAQVCSACWAGLPVPVSASQAIKQGPGRHRACSPPGQGLCQQHGPTQGGQKHQGLPAATKPRARLRKEHISCVSVSRRQMDAQGSGLDSITKAKHLLTPPHLQCHKFPTQLPNPLSYQQTLPCYNFSL